MKAVLLSIKPKYCELIASGKKTIEVRKTKPKLQPPFKCLIYCTKPKYEHEDYISFNEGTEQARAFYGGGKIIGEFVCDGIIDLHDNGNEFVNPFNSEITELLMPFSSLSYKELHDYANGKQLYGWHISDLKIYDKPKELSEFFIVDKKAVKECSLRERIYTNPDYTHGVCLPGTYICNKDPVDVDFCRGGCWKKSLTRPPQSWCYVEEDE